MDLKRRRERQFVVFLMDEVERVEEVAEVANSLKNSNTKICYVCLSRPYTDVCKDLKSRGVKLEKFYFIDTLSAYYGKKKPTSNCTFADSPAKLDEIKRLIISVIKQKNCNTVILDSVSAMLIYQQRSNIVRFTHELLSEEKGKENLLYMAFKQSPVPPGENESLIQDLNMFADKMIDISLKHKDI